MTLCGLVTLGNQADPGLLTFCGGMTPPAAASGLDLRITEQASELSADDVLEHLAIQRQVRDDLL